MFKGSIMDEEEVEIKLTGKALGGVFTKPELAVGEYIVAKQNESLPRRKPEWDLARSSPAAELAVAQRELAAAERALAEKRKEQVERRKQMDGQWDDLRNQELALKDLFVQYQKFVKENQEKRERAQIKVRAEREIQSQSNYEIALLKEKVAELSLTRTDIEAHVGEYHIYEDFLNHVMALTPEFDAVADVLNRYETLASARTSLAEQQDRDLTELERARNEMVQLSKDKSQTIMRMNSMLANLQARHDQASAEAARWESAVAHVKEVAALKKLELEQVRSACRNVYKQMCSSKGIPPDAGREDYEVQLEFIKTNLPEMKKVVRIAQRKVGSKDNASNVVKLSKGTSS